MTTKFNIGSREAYIPALKDGSIDVIPDYTGNLLQYLDPDATATSAADVDAALRRRSVRNWRSAPRRPAEDKDAVVVTQETAQRWNLTSIADLAPHSAEVKFGAPAEFQERRGGLPGLKANYGLDITAEQLRADRRRRRAGHGGRAGDGQMTAAEHLHHVSRHRAEQLRGARGSEEQLPGAERRAAWSARAKNSDKLTQALDAVSAKLTTEELIALNDSVSGDAKNRTASGREAWVTQQGLDKPVG